MINEEIADVFDKMSRLLAFKGADRFRILAYERAARELRDYKEDLEKTAREGKLEEIPGIGKDLSEMIREYIKKRRVKRYDQERRGIPDSLIEMMDIPGIGPKTLALLHAELSIESYEDLKRAIDAGALTRLSGFGEKKVENLRRGIELWLSSKRRMPLGIALPLADRLLEMIRRNELVERAEVAGSVRRRRDTIGDFDILVISSDSELALKQLVRLPPVKRVLAVGETRATVIAEGVQVDVRAIARESFGAAMQYFTGGKEHNVHLRTIAAKKGLKLNEYGVFRDDERLGGRTEEEVYRLCGINVLIPSELREDRGEIEAALGNRLPELIEVEDLRGDLHAHTTYSDGRSTIEEMAEAAAKLGYEYIALADHSPSARIANGLDEKRLEKKMAELEAVRARRKGKLSLLLGSEVDILSNGKLDYPDRMLKLFDVVTASVHTGFKQSRDRMTGRMLDAISNPHVHILGHPTTRLIGSREPVDFDFEKVVEAAAESGVALEINASIYRLDVTDTMARVAVGAGCVLAINSDAHSAAHLEQIEYGVFQARRGWVEARSVVNTWPRSKLLRWLRRRR